MLHAMDELPIACTLSPEQLSARRESFLVDLAAAAMAKADLPGQDGSSLDLPGDAATAKLVSRVAASLLWMGLVE